MLPSGDRCIERGSLYPWRAAACTEGTRNVPEQKNYLMGTRSLLVPGLGVRVFTRHQSGLPMYQMLSSRCVWVVQSQHDCCHRCVIVCTVLWQQQGSCRYVAFAGCLVNGIVMPEHTAASSSGHGLLLSANQSSILHRQLEGNRTVATAGCFKHVGWCCFCKTRCCMQPQGFVALVHSIGAFSLVSAIGCVTSVVCHPLLGKCCVGYLHRPCLCVPTYQVP